MQVHLPRARVLRASDQPRAARWKAQAVNSALRGGHARVAHEGRGHRVEAQELEGRRGPGRRAVLRGGEEPLVLLEEARGQPELHGRRRVGVRHTAHAVREREAQRHAVQEVQQGRRVVAHGLGPRLRRQAVVYLAVGERAPLEDRAVGSIRGHGEPVAVELPGREALVHLHGRQLAEALHVAHGPHVEVVLLGLRREGGAVEEGDRRAADAGGRRRRAGARRPQRGHGPAPRGTRLVPLAHTSAREDHEGPPQAREAGAHGDAAG
mmetsp:Transcript_17958/g.60142  ORF Transcript_17958/g.60142 Transcript_17958/m.60142 type:complete len:266 (-) Transcript_17958:62-859(-)